MIDDDVLTRLVELHDHIQVPETVPGADAFRGKRILRRRRTLLVGATAAAVVAVLGVVAATTGGPLADRDIDPVRPGPTQGPTPTPTETPSAAGEWPLERIRAEGHLEDELVTDSGLTARTYVLCDGTSEECSPSMDGPIRRAHEHMAIEVSQDGRTALFGMYRGNNWSFTALGEDAVLVMDVPPNALGNLEDVRHRVLRAKGTEVLLRISDGRAPAVPGPDVFVIDYNWLIGERVAMQHAFRVNELDGTMQLLDVPLNTELGYVGIAWGPNAHEFLWFVSAIDCRVFWVADGTVESRRPCGSDFKGHWYNNLSSVDADWFPDGWLKPGRMAVLEHNDGHLILLVSLDQGTSWQRISVSEEDAIPDALQRLG